MKPKFVRIIGISLIVCTWFIWGAIILLPFLKLTRAQYLIYYPVLLLATNIFWVGAALVGKELIRKYNIFGKIRAWFTRLRK